MKFHVKKCLTVAALVAAPFLNAQAGEGNNHAALFVGQTDGYSTVGVEYEYRTGLMDRMIGFGAVYEQFSATHYDATVLVAGVVIHPWKDLKLNISAGTEGTSAHGINESHSLTRIGVAYDFHYENISYGPVYNSDTVNGHSVDVIGLAVGMGF